MRRRRRARHVAKWATWIEALTKPERAHDQSLVYRQLAAYIIKKRTSMLSVEDAAEALKALHSVREPEGRVKAGEAGARFRVFRVHGVRFHVFLFPEQSETDGDQV